jgi:hypothetical protein
MALDKRTHQIILGLATFLEGKKDEPAPSEEVCLEFLGEIIPLMLDPMVVDRHCKLRKVCMDYSIAWREAMNERR